tara:strand:+ start:421 stop:615 length:195 start_codon:yes stop_codon:yes gene_type:complete
MYHYISDKEDYDILHSPHRITITKAEIYKNDLVKRVQKIKDIDESLYIQIKTAINIYSLKKNRN